MPYHPGKSHIEETVVDPTALNGASIQTYTIRSLQKLYGVGTDKPKQHGMYPWMFSIAVLPDNFGRFTVLYYPLDFEVKGTESADRTE